MAVDWIADVKKYVPNADEAAIAGIVRHCGIALRSRDAALVSFSDSAETDRVRESFLKKKLALTNSDADLDAAIGDVGTVMQADRTKNRVTVYYLLAEKFDKLALFIKQPATKKADAKSSTKTDTKSTGKAAAGALAAGVAAAAGAASPKKAATAGKPKAAKVAKPASKAAASAATLGAAGVAAAATALDKAEGGAKSGAATTADKVSGTVAAAGEAVANTASGAAALAGAAVAGTAALAATAATGTLAAAGAATTGLGDAASAGAVKVSSAVSGAASGLASAALPDESRGKWGWLLWLLAAALLLALILWMFGCAPFAANGPATNAVDETTAASSANSSTAASPEASVAAQTLASAPIEGSVAIPNGDGVTVETRDGKPVVKVYFASGRTAVAPAFVGTAGGLAAYVADHAGASLNISGFADKTGNAAINAALSKKRAEAVKSALLSAGLAETAIALIKPSDITAAEGGTANAASRRVEVTVK